MVRVVKKNTFLLALAILVLIMLGFVVYKQFGDKEAPKKSMSFGPIGVTSVIAKEEKIPYTIEALGTAKANESVIITSKVTETVNKINFLDGDKVDKGTVLVELTNDEETAQLEEEQSTLAEAEKQYKRIKNLVKKNAATQSRLDEQFALMNSARARVHAISARISDRSIKAPFSGLLGLRDVSPGSLVTPGTQITTLDDIDQIKLDFSVPETLLSQLKKGTSIQATSPSHSSMVFNGMIETVDLRIDPVTRSATVRAIIKNENHVIKPGMLMSVKITGEATENIIVPEAVLIPRQDKQFVFKITADGIAQRQEVTVGKRLPGKVEILSGLNPGDKVIVDGTIKVKDGAPVRVLNTGDISK